MFLNDIDDITFWGMNIPKEVEEMVNKTKVPNRPYMTDGEFQAYCLGIENTISTMKQLLDQGEDGKSITFYNPNAGLEAIEYRADDLVQLLFSQNMKEV